MSCHEISTTKIFPLAVVAYICPKSLTRLTGEMVKSEILTD